MPKQGKHISICIITVLLAACGSGDDSSTETGSGGTVPAPAPSPSPSPSPSPAPTPVAATVLTTSEGAADGLVGCLNKGLYSWGEIAVRRSVEQTAVSIDPTGLTETTVQNFSSEVLHTALTGPVGTAHYRLGSASNYDRYVLRDDTLFSIGNTRYGTYLLHPVPVSTRFNLNVGETHAQPGGQYYGERTTGGDPKLTTTDWTQTYRGRETVTVPAGTFEACRVDIAPTTTFQASRFERWYAVGSGIVVKEINYQSSSRRPEGNQLVGVYTKVLLSASIGSTPVRP